MKHQLPLLEIGVDNPTRLSIVLRICSKCHTALWETQRSTAGKSAWCLWGWSDFLWLDEQITLRGQTLLFSCYSRGCAYFQFFIIEGCQNKKAVWTERFMMTLEFLMDAKSHMMDVPGKLITLTGLQLWFLWAKSETLKRRFAYIPHVTYINTPLLLETRLEVFPKRKNQTLEDTLNKKHDDACSVKQRVRLIW